MRIGLAIAGWGALLAGHAHASSFVTVAPPPEPVSASFVVIGEFGPSVAAPLGGAKPALRSALDAPPDFRWGGAVPVSRSIVAMGEPAIQVAEAAPESSGRTHPLALPVVIRGGIVGDAAPQPAVARSEPGNDPIETTSTEAVATRQPNEPGDVEEEAKEALAAEPPSGPPPALGEPE